jgi:hypothetical protein
VPVSRISKAKALPASVLRAAHASPLVLAYLDQFGPTVRVRSFASFIITRVERHGLISSLRADAIPRSLHSKLVLLLLSPPLNKT